MGNIIKYIHHGETVSVEKHLKGKHREHCLCWQNCKNFKPEDKKNNCPIASKLFQICVDEKVVTPVWECSQYAPAIMKQQKSIKKDDLIKKAGFKIAEKLGVE